MSVDFMINLNYRHYEHNFNVMLKYAQRLIEKKEKKHKVKCISCARIFILFLFMIDSFFLYRPLIFCTPFAHFMWFIDFILQRKMYRPDNYVGFPIETILFLASNLLIIDAIHTDISHGRGRGVQCNGKKLTTIFLFFSNKTEKIGDQLLFYHSIMT